MTGAVVAWLLGACGGGAEEPPLGPGAEVPSGLALDARLTVTDAAVTVDYRFTNGSGAVVLLADRPARPSGAGVRYDAATAYVVGDADRDDAILVTQRVFAWPDGFEAVTPPVVGVTEVAPGATVERAIEVARPFVRLHPFGDDLGDGTIALPPEPATVTFCLGVLPSPLPTPAAAREEAGVTVVAHGTELADAQAVLCAEAVDLR